MRIFMIAAAIVALVANSASADKRLTLGMEIVQNARQQCEDFENGQFHSAEKTVTLDDITGDGRPEELVDASQFSCSTASSLWGGSGGTYLWVIVDGKTVVEDGKVPSIDLDKLGEEANAVNQRWKARYGYEYPDSFEPL